jgi:cysteine-rich repeat protein
MEVKGGDCVEVCGDGMRLSSEIECDDGNNDDGDGCSSSCKLETGWFCNGGDSVSTDICKILLPFTVRVDLIESDAEYPTNRSFRISFSKRISYHTITNTSNPKIEIPQISSESYSSVDK